MRRLPKNPTRELKRIEREERRREAERCRDSLTTFFRLAWPHIEPGVDLQWPTFPGESFGYLDILCQELEAVARGETRRWVFMIPPRHLKSTLVSVVYPAWRWLRDPTHRMQFLSGSDRVRKRDSRKCRNLIESGWYQGLQEALGREEWGLADDQNTKTNYANSCGGQRFTGVIGGKVTGDGADEQVLDDPYDAKEASEGTANRIRERMEEVVRNWDNVLSDRLNDERTNPRGLIMQALHPDDLACTLRERNNVRAACFQSEYRPDWAYNHPDDPRTDDGELLNPRRYPKALLDEKRQKDELHKAKHQQEPTPPQGNLIRKTWTNRRWTQEQLTEEMGHGGTWYQSWDPRNSGQSKESSFAIAQLWFEPSRRPSELWLVEQKRQKWDVSETLNVFRRTQEEPLWCRASEILVEFKADGRTIVPLCKDDIPGIVPIDPKGGKGARLSSTQPFWRAGNILLPPDDRPWVTEYIEEITALPDAAYDDQGDATSQMIRHVRLPDADRVVQLDGESEAIDDWKSIL